jgi:hypothetical protein
MVFLGHRTKKQRRPRSDGEGSAARAGVGVVYGVAMEMLLTSLVGTVVRIQSMTAC